MKKLLLLLLILLCSCIKVTTEQNIQQFDYHTVAQRRGDTTYYYQIIGIQNRIINIDSICIAKKYYYKDKTYDSN